VLPSRAGASGCSLGDRNAGFDMIVSVCSGKQPLLLLVEDEVVMLDLAVLVDEDGGAGTVLRSQVTRRFVQ
jgi:hypothetical protein